MNRLILDKENRKQFLILCQSLLPEYNPIWENAKNDGWSEEYISLYKKGDETQDSIHWVELCLTRITQEIDYLYCEKYINHITRNGGPYPEDWKEIWNNRPYHTIWNNFNLGYPKKNMVDFLCKLYKELTK